MGWTQAEIDKAFVDVKKKAVTDKNFRAKLLADPAGAIKVSTGKEIPASFKIKVIEGDPKYHMTFVLPDMVSEEINEADLEKVAGGGCVIDFGGCGAQACAAKASAEASVR